MASDRCGYLSKQGLVCRKVQVEPENAREAVDKTWQMRGARNAGDPASEATAPEQGHTRPLQKAALGYQACI